MKIRNNRKRVLTSHDIKQQIHGIPIPLTQVKSLEEIIVSIYKWIREFPFEIKLDKRNYSQNLEYIKTHKRGSCTPKHYFLGTICETLGVSVEYLTYPFYWLDLPVAYPNSLKKLAKALPLSYHLAIRIRIEKGKFLLDATWDSPLKKAGFPITKIENELIDTKLAVVPAGECIIHKTILDREKFIEAISRTRGSRMIREKIEFYTAFNNWLEFLRKKPSK